MVVVPAIPLTIFSNARYRQDASKPTMPNKADKRSKEVQALQSRLKQLQRDTATRCFIMRNLPSDPPAILNSGDVWHSRTVSWTTVAGSGTYPILGTADCVLTL